jgi:hypothetical protein
VKVVGNGTTAGTIDLGGGPLGSGTVMTGGNSFDQTVAAGTVAISLTHTDGTATVDALGNMFADLNAIQDATHGGGTGMIAVSQGTSTCPGTLAIDMGNFTVPEGTPYNGPVATYTINPPVPPGPFTATIDWGDSSSSTGTISQPGGSGTPFVVSGTHTYAAAGVYLTSVTIHDASTDFVAPGPGTAVVTDPAPVVTVPPLSATAGVPTGALAVATFTDPGTPLPVSQYMATVDWGDKTPPILGVITQSGTTYTVTGGHTYVQAGKYTITVNVQSQLAPPGVGTGPASVSGMSVMQPTSIALAPPLPNPSAFGQQVTFVATVTPSGGGAPPPAGESVTFLDGTATLGTAPLDSSGQARFVTSNLAPGIHSVAAQYPGDANFAASTSIPVSQAVLSPPVLQATTTQLTSSPNPSIAGEAVTFTAIVTPSASSGAGSPTGTVTFTIDGVAQTAVALTPMGSNAQASFTTAALATGSHSVVALYSGDPNFASSTSPALTEVVQPATAPPRVVSLQRFGFHAMPTKLVLTFSSALDPARAMNVAEYQVVALLRGRKGRLRVGPSVPVVQASYTAGALTSMVTLSLAKRLNVHNLYQLAVNGAPPSGITDTSGQFLDGKGNGQVGTNYVRIFGADVLAGPSAM